MVKLLLLAYILNTGLYAYDGDSSSSNKSRELRELTCDEQTEVLKSYRLWDYYYSISKDRFKRHKSPYVYFINNGSFDYRWANVDVMMSTTINGYPHQVIDKGVVSDLLSCKYKISTFKEDKYKKKGHNVYIFSDKY
ncbi:MAG: hypothetical protein GQ474_03810 [Sulfurimonas sp.]|nr:hypothetical protein [Sulfurimonas sp.]